MTAAAAEEASQPPAAHAAIHHAVVVVRDLAVSLRFYRDVIGLDELQDRHVEGDWPGLFDAPSRGLRAVFLGDARVPDDHAGVLELNVFGSDVPVPSRPRRSPSVADSPTAATIPGGA
jgi:catechol 2,3-dioxygenase-like lactoylglutathione lyase family enzyme